MAGWHHRLDAHEFEWIPGVGVGQGGLVCCASWDCNESDMTQWLSWTELKKTNIKQSKWWPWWISRKTKTMVTNIYIYIYIYIYCSIYPKWSNLFQLFILRVVMKYPSNSNTYRVREWCEWATPGGKKKKKKSRMLKCTQYILQHSMLKEVREI